jgi:hypothetical protein
MTPFSHGTAVAKSPRRRPTTRAHRLNPGPSDAKPPNTPNFLTSSAAARPPSRRWRWTGGRHVRRRGRPSRARPRAAGPADPSISASVTGVGGAARSGRPLRPGVAHRQWVGRRWTIVQAFLSFRHTKCADTPKAILTALGARCRDSKARCRLDRRHSI